jgi:hypothetical protein
MMAWCPGYFFCSFRAVKKRTEAWRFSFHGDADRSVFGSEILVIPHNPFYNEQEGLMLRQE